MNDVSEMNQSTSGPRVAIVGGGLAGMAAAVALLQRGVQVELFESRRMLGGRATSFRDPASGELVDHCQHVSMGCCTNVADFCRRTGIESLFRRQRRLHFIGPGGRQCDFEGARWLPAPLHLGPALWGLKYFSIAEQMSVARTLLKLAGTTSADERTVGQWLREQRQSERLIELFWAPVLVSALGESLDRASLGYARQVFVTGFMAAQEAYELVIPTVPLGELYGERLQAWFIENRVRLHLSTPVAKVMGDKLAAEGIQLADERALPFDFVIVATTWRRAAELLPQAMRDELGCKRWSEIDSAPISGVHLWFDRPITPLEHAVLVGRLSQWLFYRGQTSRDGAAAHYYQVVISASRSLAGREHADILDEVCGELRAIWPAAGEARLLHGRVVTEPAAVFSATPGIDRLRPTQRTAIGNLLLAGDWTATGWPATMEGAVRSGYLAAAAVLEAVGRPEPVLVDDLPIGRLARWLGCSIRVQQK
jgi:squalene-associated FAD-dependent desaturase